MPLSPDCATKGTILNPSEESGGALIFLSKPMIVEEGNPELQVMKGAVEAAKSRGSYGAGQRFFPLLHLHQAPKSPLPRLFHKGELSGIPLQVPL